MLKTLVYSYDHPRAYWNQRILNRRVLPLLEWHHTMATLLFDPNELFTLLVPELVVWCDRRQLSKRTQLCPELSFVQVTSCQCHEMSAAFYPLP